MASTVREKDIKKLREAGYLAKKISHRLPTVGQVVPTPEPQEGCIPPSLCPRARVSPPPVRSWHHVLFWARSS